MSLTDVMSHAGFSGYAQVGFVVSLLAFVGIVAWVVRRPKTEMKAHARLALDDDSRGTERRRPS
jgi:cbb3-type cytochrome oxidase subunit 3